jgi:hypothetical protein
MYIDINNLDIKQMSLDYNISQKYITSSICKSKSVHCSKKSINYNKEIILKKIVEDRGIEFVIHFTRIENLKSILDNGIKSRKKLEKYKMNSIFNDEYRIDGFENATCCSICHPNYKMFYSLRQSNPKQEWAVIGIKKDIIWKKDCAFCIENAASSNVTSIPIEQRKGKKAFKKLFDELTTSPTRKELKIPDSCPTNPQAEILVFEDIKPEDIVGVAFNNSTTAEEYKKLYKDFQFIYHRAFFGPRLDYEFWR